MSKTYTKEELREILTKHRKWYFSETGGERADLSSADLRGADLSSADLQGAYLQGAYLQRAYLRGADLRGAYLQGAKIDINSLDYMLVPEEGEFIAYKSVHRITGGKAVLTVRVPADAERTSCLINRKCRVSKAIATKAEDLNGDPIDDMEFLSEYSDGSYMHAPYRWRLNELMEPDSYDPSPLVDCSHGLHIFATKKEARKW